MTDFNNLIDNSDDLESVESEKLPVECNIPIKIEIDDKSYDQYIDAAPNSNIRIKQEISYDIRDNEVYLRNDLKYENGLDDKYFVLEDNDVKPSTNISPGFCCSVCNHIAKTEDSLQKHLISRHDVNTKTIFCELCEYNTKNRTNLKNHINQRHSVNPFIFPCDLCDYKAKQKVHLQYHINARHSENPIVYPCDKCGFQAKEKSKLKRHILQRCCSKKDYVSRSRKKHQDLSILKGNDSISYACVFCTYSSRHKGCLIRHIYTQHTSGIEYYFCHHCNYKSKQKQNIKRHIILRHNVDAIEYPCEFCDYKSKQKDNLKRHINQRHNVNPTIYPCEFCDYTAKQKTDLKKHINSRHSLHPELFHCDLCTYTTKYKKNVKLHVRHRHKYEEIIDEDPNRKIIL